MIAKIPEFISKPARAAVPAIAALLALCAESVPAGVPQLPSIMDHDPELPRQHIVRHVPAHWKQLWREALAGQEEDLRREAAAAVLREHQRGCPDVDDMGPDLLNALSLSSHSAVRQTIAEALIELDFREAAGALSELAAAGGTAESLLVEPALGSWGYNPINDVWLTRLNDARSATPQRLMLAIEGVLATGDVRAGDALRLLALDRGNTAAVRLAAAQSLGRLRSDGLTGDARLMAESSVGRGIVDRLVAANLLLTHSSDDARELMLQLAVDDQPAVAAIVLRRLLELEPRHLRPLVPRLLESRDAVVRQLAARSLVERPDNDTIGTLGRLLDDSHPDVRNYVRESLLSLAGQPEFDAAVRDEAMAVLTSQSWRGLEQAARLLGELDHKPGAERLVGLLNFERAEVHVTAAWSLSQLAVRDTLPGMAQFATSITDRFPADPGDGDREPLSRGHDACLSHLFQAFGMMKYSQPEPVLLKFVPRRYDLGPRSRGAAIWALGRLHEDDPQPELMKLLGQRVADDGEIPYPEPVEVRANAATSLGRMKAAAAMRALRHVYGKDPPGERIREACGWAIEQITGEDLPELETRLVSPPDAFLRPIDP
ncbi:MAG: HEAT repeat domain-containing protein [Planctomycetaceae bacterium]